MQHTPTILVIDDDQGMVTLLTEAFQEAGYHVLSSNDGAAGLELARQVSPDLVLVDLVMPKMDGYTVCRELRQRSNAPIVIISGVQDELHRIAGFELGANDFVTKPFGLGELLARVRSLLRWRGVHAVPTPPQEARADTLVAGRLQVDLSSRQVWRDNQELELTQKEFDLLVYLMQRANIALSRNHLMEQLWTDAFNSGPRTIDVHVHSLREKIEENPALPRMIQTVRGVGYRFHNPQHSRSINEGE